MSSDDCPFALNRKLAPRPSFWHRSPQGFDASDDPERTGRAASLLAACQRQNPKNERNDAMTHDVRLTTEEEVTLRRVAYGQSDARDMRRRDLARLRQLLLIEDGKDGPRLTVAGKRRFDILPKAPALDRSSSLDDMLTMIGQRLSGPRQ
jgi:hypothetical protein